MQYVVHSTYITVGNITLVAAILKWSTFYYILAIFLQINSSAFRFKASQLCSKRLVKISLLSVFHFVTNIKQWTPPSKHVISRKRSNYVRRNNDAQYREFLK